MTNLKQSRIGKKVDYLGHTWKVIDVLPSGSLALRRWVMGGRFPVVYPYRGVVFTSPTAVVWHELELAPPQRGSNRELKK